MTVGAHVTTCDQSLDGARRTMRDQEIRHLPVLQGGAVVGILSARDLAFIDRLPGIRSTLVVENAMTAEPCRGRRDPFGRRRRPGDGAP